MLGICVLVNMISKADIINYSLDYTKNGLITYLIVFLATSVFTIFLRTVVDYLTKALCRECEYNGKRKIFDVTCYKELNDIEKKDTQNIIKDSLYMLEEISSYIAGVGETVYNCTMGAGIIIYLMFSGVIIIIPITVMIFDMMLSQKKGNAFMSDFWFKYRQNTNRYNYLSDIMIQKNYIEERKVYRTTDKLNKEFLHEFDKAKQLNCKNGKRRLRLDCSMEAKSRIYMIVMALIFAYYVCSGQMMIGKFVICLECIGILQTIVEKESSKYADKKKYYAMIENYKKYVSIMKNDIKCGCSLEMIKNSNIKDDITIVFDKVSYSYPFGEQVIKDFTYTFKKGKFYLIKGHNGAGKSTLIKLALGLYNPDSGTVKINGIDANRLDNELRSRIFSVILQDGNKYPFKVRDNIFFDPDSSYEDISIYLKDKKKLSVYNKLIEKSGVALLNAEEDSTDFSGGEWQQILYLRAALKDYEILIADEPTSKLDIAMRKIIIEKINALKDKKMIIMVSHNSEDEKFLFMFAIRIVFAIIPVITIKVTGIMFELLNIREFTAMLVGILIMYVILLMINKMQIIVYERYIIQYIYMIEFERETKKILHEKCLKLKAEDFNDTSINTKTFEARTASINIFRTMEMLVDFVAIVVEVLLIVGYFITLNTWYSVMIVCAIVPSVIRQVKKLTQQRTVQELLLKKKQNIQMLEKTVYSPKYFYENKVINNFNYIITKWKSKQEEYNSICREKELKNCVIDCAFGLLSQVGYAGGFLVAVAIYLQDKNIANFSASFIAFSMLNDIIQNFIDEYGYLSQFIIMTEPFFKFMDLHDDIEVNKYGDKIILENVSYKYDNKMVLDGINLEINRGEKVALLGRNGSGKSTLLKIITGIYKPYSGTVTTFIKSNSEISALFQNYGRYPLTVEKNITIANDYRYCKQNDICDYNTINCIDVGKLLDMVGMDYIDKNEMLGKELGDRELSGGEWQRIAIARCMLRVVGDKAKLLIMDEPDSEIDKVGEHMICDIMEM